MPTPEQIAVAYERMLMRCEPDGECLIFKGGCDSHGYGVVRVGEHVMGAHRLAYIARHGNVGDKCVLHRCDRPPCVADEHHFLGTQADNLADCIAKGRARRNPVRGEGQPASKLTEAEVQEIRAIAGCFPQSAIAREYGVSQALVGRIIRGEAWTHLLADNDDQEVAHA